MNLRKIRLILILTLIPEVLVLAFFVFSRTQSPPAAGRALTEKLEIPRPAIVAHRGASYLAPEETRAAYLLARDLGADYLEGDVQRTRDGALVLVHDDTLERTSNVAQVFPGRETHTVDTFTLAELSRLDFGSWFNEKNKDRARDRFKGLKIVTVEELIEIAESGNQSPGLYLETKSPERYPGIETELVNLLKRKGWLGERKCGPDLLPGDSSARKVATAGCGKSKVIFQSFSADSIKKLLELAPNVARVLLVDQEMEKKQGWNGIVADAVRMDAHLGPVGYLGWSWYTGPAHRAGRIVHIYTINSSWQLWLLSQLGADGFFTDRSELALEFFGRITKPDVETLFSKLVF
ncbi:MAG: glycerophosphodiester phosphodiesterase [Spirochaetia bacterium]|nr:glycerophosphodiester phosphodiesterase [Spirochaetia bacterium]